jgi:hypothetical protein
MTDMGFSDGSGDRLPAGVSATSRPAPRPPTAHRLSPAILLICLLLLLPGRPAHAAELVMVETRGCPWCLIWHREIGPAYPRTPAGRLAPLRTIDLSRLADSGIALAAPVRATPTFLVVDDRLREVGRIEGYPGADFFWGLLDAELAKLPRRTLPPSTFSPSPVSTKGL